MSTSIEHFRIQSWVLLFVFLFMGFSLFGQLSSRQLNLTTSVSPENSEVQIIAIQATALLDDVSEFGGLHLLILTEEGIPVAQLDKNKDQLIADGELLGQNLNISFTNIDYSIVYNAEFHVRRNDGANYPVLTNTLNNQ